MSIAKRLFQMRLTVREIGNGKRILVSVMLPILIFNLTSMNFFALEMMRASADETTVTEVAPKAEEEAKEEVLKEEIKKEEAPKAVEKNALEVEPEVKKEVSKETVVEVPKLESLKPEIAIISESASKVEIVTEKAAEKAIVIDPLVVPVLPEKTPIILNPRESIATFDNLAKTSEVEMPALMPKLDDSPLPIVAAPKEAPVMAKEIWSKDGNREVTDSVVELGKKYIAPQNEQVSVTFTKLPASPGTLSIEEITLTERQVASFGALSNKAYDITSSMEDGTFKYELTLPALKNEKNIEVKFAEKLDELKDAKKVPESDVEIKKDTVSLAADHFTIFIIAKHTGNMGVFMDWNYLNCDQRSASGNDYLSMTKSDSVLISPTMNFSNTSAEALNFKARTYGGVSGGSSVMTVSISDNDGSNWNILGTVTPASTTLQPQTAFDLSGYAGLNIKIKIETLGAVSNKGVGLDDIRIEGVNSEKKITAFAISGQIGTTTINETSRTILVNMPIAGTDIAALTPTISISENAMANPASGAMQDFTDPVSYVVTAEDSSTQNYLVTVKLLPVISHVQFSPNSETVGIGQTIRVTFKSGTTPGLSGTAIVNGHAFSLASVMGGEYYADYIVEEGDTNILESVHPGIPVSVELWNQDHTAYTTDYGTHSTDPGVDATRPTCSVSLAENPDSGYQYIAGDTFYYAPNNASPSWIGTFTTTITASDGETGMQKVEFPNIFKTSGTVDGATDMSAPFLNNYFWQKSPNFPDNLTNTGNGLGAHSITCYDNAGNTNVATVNIVQDNTQPALTSVTLDSYLVKDGATINVDAVVSDVDSGIGYCHAFWSTDNSYGSDADLGDLGVDCDGVITVPAGAGTFYLIIRVGDNVGYWPDSIASSAVLVDDTAPITSDDVDGSWHNSNVTVTLDCNDTGGSTCEATYYTTDGSTPDASSAVGNSFTLSADGEYIIKYFSKDHSGNSEVVRTAASQVKIDKINPTDPSTPMADVTSPTNETSVTWSWATSDATISGLKNYIWNLFQGATNILAGTASSTAQTIDLSSYGDGNFSFNVYAQDDALNSSAVMTSIASTVDITLPTVDAGENRPHTGPFNQDGLVSDAMSGIFSIDWSQVSGPGVITFGNLHNEDTSVWASLDGGYVARLSATDYAGNAAYAEFEFNYDVTNPVITLSGNSPMTVGQGEIFTDPGASAHDNIDGDITANITTGRINLVDTNVLGDYLITYAVSDATGNEANQMVRTVRVADITAPTAPEATPPAGEYLTEQSVTLASSDNGSGLDAIYYTIDGTIPDKTKAEYAGAISVSCDLTIRAIAYDKTGNVSDILEATYEIAPVISGEALSSITETTLTIAWLTDNLATSRVVYDTISHATLGVAPNYGYANSTIELDNAPKVTAHSVFISGLLAGTTYYYRTISHGSPESVSIEKSFTTNEVVLSDSSHKHHGDNDNDGGGDSDRHKSDNDDAVILATVGRGMGTVRGRDVSGEVQGEEANRATEQISGVEDKLDKERDSSTENLKEVSGRKLWHWMLAIFVVFVLGWWIVRWKR